MHKKIRLEEKKNARTKHNNPLQESNKRSTTSKCIYTSRSHSSTPVACILKIDEWSSEKIVGTKMLNRDRMKRLYRNHGYIV
jgi:hypothetical protein